MTAAPMPPIDDPAIGRVVGELHDLAGGWGVPAAMQYSLDLLPGSSLADVGYELSVSLGLLIGGVAEAVATTAGLLRSPAPGGQAPTATPVTTARAQEARSPSGSVAVASAVARAAWRPYVHPWMLVDPALPQHAVDRLDALVPRLDTLLRSLTIDPGAAQAVVDAAWSAREAFADLVAALADHRPHLHRLLRTSPFAPREVRRHTDLLSRADALAHQEVTAAVAGLPTLADLLPGRAGPTSLADLPLVPTDELPGRIAGDVDLLAALTDPAREGAPEWLAGAMTSPPGAEAAVGDARTPSDESLLRVARVRQACAGRTAEELTRAALEWPRLVGGLDGFPLAERQRANRVLMRADLYRLKDEDTAYGARIRERRRHDARRPWRRVQAAVLDAWLANDAITGMATVEHDRPVARRVEHRAMITLTQQLLHDRVDQGRGVRAHRQVHLYSPQGRVVEVCGLLDADTRAVAVYVGGTGTTVRQFGWPTGIARALQRADPTGRTAVVTWMGAQFPSAIGTQSPWGRYATRAAAPLRDCVEGLSVPDGVPITVIGHSYGGVIVGAAEALGMRVDRVVHAGVPGIGPGVGSVRDYPEADALGRARRVARYALTAPGDLIRVWRRGSATIGALATLPSRRARRLARWISQRTLGADPMTLAGIVTLDPGRWEVDKDDRRAGDVLYGPKGHADVVEPGTTAFRRIVAVIQGQDPTV